MTRSWILDELAHAGPEHLAPSYVEAYDAKSGVDPVDDVAVLRRFGIDESSTVLDLGAGTGRFVLQVAPYCKRVVAVDVSAAMLDALAKNVAGAGLHNVNLVQAGFLTYEHRGDSVDAVYTRHALHHLPDFWKGVALDRIAGLLRPGGVLRLRDLIYDFDPADAELTIDRWLEGAAPDPRIGYTRDDLAEHVRTEFSTFRWLIEPMLERCGFEIGEVTFDRGVYGRYTCVRR